MDKVKVKIGQRATDYDGATGEVVSVQNGIVGIKTRNGDVVYRYERQIASLYGVSKRSDENGYNQKQV